jgi:hypothetical protein
MTRLDWTTVRDRASAVLAADPENTDAKAYLEMAARGLAGDTPAPPASEAPSTLSPTAAQPDSFANGRYVVRRFLGEGGKKKVYLAHDSRLDRDVAFALIKTEGLDAAARERITREAQAMGRLGSHPNIVTVYDIGDESGQPFLVLPVLEGGDVEGLIEKAPEHKLPLEEVVRIGADTCEGLEFLHTKGLVHRDVKPGNTWLTNEGRAMIGDFGLAVAVDRSRLTQAGMMVGTVSYMAPEQAMGGEVTPRADLYALGAMLYEMVCGRPPFVGDESVAIIGQHLNTPPVAPTWHRPDCPPALEALILRLLEKDPGKRPSSATEVRDALRGVSLSLLPGGEGGRRPDEGETSRTSTTAASPGADPLYRTVFVGREPELKQLQSTFDTAISGQGGLVMVVGEPGIGKTAICQQLATYVSLRGGRTLVGHCYEEGSLSLPYLAFVEAMRTYVLARDPDGLRSDLGTGAADVARIVSEVRDRVAVELRDAGDPEDDRWRLLQSVTTFLRNAASVQPLVIVLEDLHWADRGTLDLLQHVARNLQGARLVVVGTYRDVEVDRAHPLSGAVAELRRSGTFLRVSLRGLTVDEVHRMYESLRGNEVPWGQAELVHRQTEGNPLFVQEVLRYLVEEGFVVRQGDRYVAQQPGEGVPEGLRDVIGRRLTHLGEKTNTVLSVASVIGRDFRLDVLQRVAGLSEDDLYAALEEAQERAIIEQVQSPAGVAFRFTHAMFRTLLYDEIFAPRRIRLHQQVGRALEDTYARRLEEHAAELAEHFSQSTETTDLEKAVHYGELAAQRAMGVYAYGEAVRHLEQALRAQEVLDPDDKEKRCDLLLAYAEAMTYSGYSRVTLEKIAPEALRAAEALGDRTRASLACQVAFGALSATGAVPIYGSPEAGAWVEAGERYAEPDSAARVHVDVAAAYRLGIMQQFALSRERLFRARELSRKLDDPALIWHADAAAGTMLQRPSDAGDLLAVNLEMLGRSPEGATLGILGQVYFMLSGTFLIMGRVRESEAARLRLQELAERVRNPHLALLALAVQAPILTARGRLSEVMELAEQMKQLGAEQNQAEQADFWLFGSFGLAMNYLGAYDAMTAPPPAVRGQMIQPRVWLLADREAAHAAIDQALERFGSVEVANLPGLLVAAIAAPAIAAEHQGGCRLVQSYYTGHGLRTNGGILGPQCIARLLGDCARILGEPETARREYEEAFTVCDEMELRPEKALASLGMAELLLEHYPDDRDAAIEHLDFAISEFREMKMQPSLERALRHRGLLKA